MEMSKIALAIISLTSLALIVHHAHAQDSPQDFLNAHNTARASVGVGPMIWDDTVADFALSYINGLTGSCILVHSSGPYGENLAGGSADLAGTAAVEMWVAERANYDYNSNSCVGGECLHYTQVVWRNSVRLGCAKVFRDDNAVSSFRLNYQKEAPSYCSNIYAGSAFAASQMLFFGEIATEIKLAPDHSTGTVVASRVRGGVPPLPITLWVFHRVLLLVATVTRTTIVEVAGAAIGSLVMAEGATPTWRS
ncbi:hypothetical protein SADUNF_Sadunf16G0172200 [Salix dunnii]|uniref:SCP domain-containing protein n=1 Tax=Salix dunnii TaxID=1413687 RepID=A0A835J9A3_9ROSI|nr:hypothetical protein SADUNF_Sadunf16G0172200 [Salix dunnii]